MIREGEILYRFREAASGEEAPKAGDRPGQPVN